MTKRSYLFAHGALHAGCITPSVAGGGTYYLSGNSWFSPAYGANGIYYRVGATLRKEVSIANSQNDLSSPLNLTQESLHMNQNVTSMHKKQSAAINMNRIGARWLVIGALVFVASFSSFAQQSALQEKLAAVKQAMADNKQRLYQYQWIETTQLTLKGDPKPPKQNLCQYGPDGQVQKTPLGPPPEQPSGRRLKQRIIEKKTEEMQEYMGDVKSLLAMYVPPDPQKMEQAKQAGNLSLNPAPGAVNLIFTNYAQPGDRMTLTFDTPARKIVSLDISTYMGKTKDTVTLRVQMASLPDGTNYVQQTLLDATAKKLQVTTTNSDYQKLGRY